MIIVKHKYHNTLLRTYYLFVLLSQFHTITVGKVRIGYC